MPTGVGGQRGDFDVGDLGEETFAVWATRAGFTVNRVGRDRGGWDLRLEREAPPVADDMAADLAPPGLVCMVQVKSTIGGRAQPISLLNWKKMIDDSSPWFVVTMELQPDGAVRRCGVQHVWLQAIARALRRLRTRQPGAAARLHKANMTLRPHHADFVPAGDPTALRAVLAAAIGDPATYAARKATMVRSTGYGPFPWQLRARVEVMDGEHPKAVLRALSLGLRPAASLELWGISDVRFGVERPIAGSATPATGEISLPPPLPSERVPLRFANANRSTSVTLFCNAFRSDSIVPLEKGEQRVYRFATPVFSALSEAGGRHFSIEWDFEDREGGVPLADLNDGVRLARLLVDASEELFVTLPLAGGPVDVAMQRRQDAPGPGWYALAAAIEDAAVVAERLGMDKGAPVTPSALLQGAKQTSLMRGLLGPWPTQSVLGFEMAQDWDGPCRRVAALLAYRIAVADGVRRVTLLCRGRGERSERGERVLLLFSAEKVSVVANRMLGRGTHEGEQAADEEDRRLARSLATEGGIDLWLVPTAVDGGDSHT